MNDKFTRKNTSQYQINPSAEDEEDESVIRLSRQSVPDMPEDEILEQLKQIRLFPDEHSIRRILAYATKCICLRK